MEQLPNGFTLELAEGAFPLSTDSMVLAHFTKLPANARVLDLGSGCGTLGLLLCASHHRCHVTGIEIDPIAHQAALENIRRNDLSHRMESICADLKQLAQVVSPGAFSCCVSNPPYFASGPASRTTPLARREDLCSLSDLIRAAALALKYGGDFFLVHRPDRLAEIISIGSRHMLETKRICLVRHKPDSPFSLVLLQLRKGGKPGVILEEATLFSSDGMPTEFYKRIYHLP